MTLNPDGVAAISFYTSDIGGNYRVSVEGILENGQPIAVEAFFEVDENGMQ